MGPNMNRLFRGVALCGGGLGGCRSRSLSGRRVVSLSRNPSASEGPSSSAQAHAQLTTLNNKQIEDLLGTLEQILGMHGKSKTVSTDVTFSAAVQENVRLCSDIVSKAAESADTSNGQGKTGLVSNDITRLCAEFLKGIGHRHWMVAGLSLLALCIERYSQSQGNREYCWNILKKLKDLAENMFELIDFLQEENLKQMFDLINEYVADCLRQLKRGAVFRFVFAPNIRDQMKELDKKIQHQFNFLTLSAVTLSLARPLKCPSFMDHDDAVGLADRVAEITSFSESDPGGVRAIVICGMLGVGTSTLGEATCARLAKERFDGRSQCWVSMKQVYEEKKLLKKQAIIFKTLLNDNSKLIDLRNGQRTLSRCFKGLQRPVLLFIDDVDSNEQLEKLLPQNLGNDLKPGSRLVVSTTHEKVVETIKKKGIQSCRRFEARLLEHDAAMELFCRKAFGTPRVPTDLNAGVEKVLQICEGHPLALEVTGKYVESRYINRSQALCHVFKALSVGDPVGPSSADRLAVLKFAYDQLGHGSLLQSAFLDIAANFVGHSWQEMHHLFGDNLLTLKELSLVKKEIRVSHTGESHAVVAMHSLIVSLGRRQDRLDHDCSRIVFAKEERPDVPVHVEGLRKVGLLHLDHCSLPSVHEKLAECWNLRHLALRGIQIDGSDNWFPSKLESFLFNCPNSRLPFPLRGMDNLVVLDVSSNREADRDLGMTFQPSPALKMLKISNSETLEEIRIENGGIAPSQLENMTIRNCPNLQRIESLAPSLKTLSIAGCRNIHDFLKLDELVGLEELRLNDCGLTTKSLKLPPNLVTLDLSDNPDLVSLPAFECSKLQRVTLRDCSKLVDGYDLAHLMSLSDVKGCPKIRRLPSRLRPALEEDVKHPYLHRLKWHLFRKSISDSHSEENTQHKQSLRKLLSSLT